MLTDTEDSWGVVSRVLHWSTAAMLVVSVSAGLWLSDQSAQCGATEAASCFLMMP